MIEPAFQPGEALEARLGQAFRPALGKSTPRELHVLEDELVGAECGQKGAIAARDLTQQLQIATHAFVNRLSAHVLEIDRDLRTRDINSQNRLGRSSAPGVCREDVRSGEFRWLIRRQN